MSQYIYFKKTLNEITPAEPGKRFLSTGMDPDRLHLPLHENVVGTDLFVPPPKLLATYMYIDLALVLTLTCHPCYNKINREHPQGKTPQTCSLYPKNQAGPSFGVFPKFRSQIVTLKIYHYSKL